MRQEKTYQESVAEFRIEDLLMIGMTIIVLGIGLAYGLNVMGDVKDDMGATACPSGYSYNTSDSTCTSASGVVPPVTGEFNATVDAIGAVAKIPSKLGLIVTVILAAVIIGILVTYLWIRFK